MIVSLHCLQKTCRNDGIKLNFGNWLKKKKGAMAYYYPTTPYQKFQECPAVLLNACCAQDRIGMEMVKNALFLSQLFPPYINP